MDPHRCLLCGETAATILRTYSAPDVYERTVGISDVGYRRAWVKCQNCDFIYSRYSRHPEALDRLYEQAYRAGDVPWRKGSTREIFDRVVALAPEESETHVRVDWIKKKIDELEKNGLIGCRPGIRRLLDVGGATGVFAYLFRDADWECHVVDPAESGRFIETDFGVPYHQGSYRPGMAGNVFDLITMIFVLEHLRDPRGLLAAVSKDLSDNGLLYIEVPDAAAFRIKAPDDDIFNSCHLWMFNPESLVRLLTDGGFEIMALSRTQTRRGHLALNVLASRGRENPAGAENAKQTLTVMSD
jgi:SAM-dependent methyltransferase